MCSFTLDGDRQQHRCIMSHTVSEVALESRIRDAKPLQINLYFAHNGQC
jgi:hypothetical protein